MKETYCRRGRSGRWACKGVVAVDSSPNKWMGLLRNNQKHVKKQTMIKTATRQVYLADTVRLPQRDTSNQYQLQSLE